MTNEELKSSLENLEKIVSNIEPSSFASAQKLEKHIMPYAEKEGDRGVLLWPLRVALSGKKASPGPFEVMEILGKEKAISRLKNALKMKFKKRFLLF